VALGGAGLDELDERLLLGDRPTAARLLPGSFVWLPPVDTERALYVQMAPYEQRLDEPLHRLGDARVLLGHQSPVPFPPGEAHPGYALGVAAVLREDLHAATPAEAERAILGYAILNDWWGPEDEARRCGWGSPRVPAQLGPVLVTPGELGDLGRLRAQARVDGTVATSTRVGGWWFSIADSIAWVSRWVGLRGGDVIGAGRLLQGSGAVAFGARVEVGVERMGWLSGQAIATGATPEPAPAGG
jgi:2-keto-4-pentenoate hydratase/2-oxohepta-3-ene-1,7-dioic acid hydratase in catechol pathway